MFVIADNCTDNTAEVAREAGATSCSRVSIPSRWARVTRSITAANVIRSQYADRGYEAYFARCRQRST